MIDNIVALDLETTGVSPDNDRIIEIGMARIVDGKVVATYNQLIDPQITLSSRITEITGITQLDLADKPTIEDVIDEVLSFIGDSVILGHNVKFDYSFLKVAASKNKKIVPNKVIDTLKIARKLLITAPSKKLTFLCEYFGIDPGHSHRAFDDAISAYRVYEKLSAIAPEEELINNPMEVSYSVKKESPITPAQLRYLTALCSQHNITLQKDINEFTKSEASKTIDGILSNVGGYGKKQASEI